VKQLVALVALILTVSASAARIPPGTTEEIKARLAPAGELCKAGESCGQSVAAAAGGSGGGLGLSGEQVYNQFCFACHMAGVGGAPKLHAVDEWAPRLAKGDEAIWQSMVNGLNAMPPKGTCMGCSDDELKAAVEFMTSAN